MHGGQLNGKLRGINTQQNIVNAALNKIRNGPVKPNVKVTANKLTQHIGEVSRPIQGNRPVSLGKLERHQKPKPQPGRKKQRPASPGIRGKVAEVPYKAYANTLKSIFIKIFEYNHVL
jgi:hypothetical protein